MIFNGPSYFHNKFWYMPLCALNNLGLNFINTMSPTWLSVENQLQSTNSSSFWFPCLSRTWEWWVFSPIFWKDCSVPKSFHQKEHVTNMDFRVFGYSPTKMECDWWTHLFENCNKISLFLGVWRSTLSPHLYISLNINLVRNWRVRLTSLCCGWKLVRKWSPMRNISNKSHQKFRLRNSLDH